MRDLLKSGEESDFVLTCTDGDLRCHRLILLASGGTLSSKVRDRLADNVSRLDITKLEVSCETGRELLLAVYGGVSSGLITEDNITYFVHFAVHFDLKWLMTEVLEVFGAVLTPENVLKLLKHHEISGSAHMTRIANEYCTKNFAQIIEKADFVSSSLDGIVMLGKISASEQKFDCYKLFKKTVGWILSKDENLRSSASVLSVIPLSKVPKGKLQTEVYDLIFNQLIIGKGDVIPQQDKVLLSTLYQEAVKTDNSTAVPHEAPQDKNGLLETRTEKSENKSNSSEKMEKPTKQNIPEQIIEKVETDSGPINTTGHKPIKRRSITSYIAGREWSNMEVTEVQAIVEQDDLADTEFLVVEGILVWIAADSYRKQHCEHLLRSCRFSSLCPVYMRAVLTTFITEKMVGSGRLTNNIFRSPSSPRPGSAIGRLAGVCDDIPLSAQRLQLGDHRLQVKCSCGGRGEAVLSVCRDLPTATVKELKCRNCGVTQIIHTACASTLTPDIFPSMHLLPFNHLARIMSSMDDIRIYIFK